MNWQKGEEFQGSGINQDDIIMADTCHYVFVRPLESTIPRVIFKLIEKLITQVGISTSKININVNTKNARKISLIGLFCPSAAIKHSSMHFG